MGRLSWAIWEDPTRGRQDGPSERLEGGTTAGFEA